jgi:predicted transcriptional regulator
MLIRKFPAVMFEDGAEKVVGIITGADLVGHKKK